MTCGTAARPCTRADKRSLQTYEQLVSAFEPHQVAGVQEEVQIREQDFGNFQVNAQHAGAWGGALLHKPLVVLRP